MTREFDCVVCGETCVDLTVGPVDRSQPLDRQGILPVGPIQAGTGGIVSNSGMALARMGLNCAGFGYVGSDDWADLLIGRLQQTGMNTTHVLRRPDQHTSTTAILVDDAGEHTFAFHAGASTSFDAASVAENLMLFDRCRFALFGYYGLFPDSVAVQLPEMLKQVRLRGCRTALDSAGAGGELQPLDKILPHLDVYVPSYDEAMAQTGRSDPRQIIRAFRSYAPDTLLGIKLGSRGAVLSTSADEWIDVQPVDPSGDVVDTTGAGDCFYAGLLCGLLKGLSAGDAGKLAAAAGACSVTQFGATTGLPTFERLAEIAGLTTAS